MLYVESSARPAVRRTLCVSVLVALSLLYNPFLAVSGSNFSLSVSHPGSYRASVASSELVRFRSTECVDHLVPAARVFSPLIAPDLSQPPSLPARATKVSIPADPLLSRSPWSRPPPAPVSLLRFDRRRLPPTKAAYSLGSWALGTSFSVSRPGLLPCACTFRFFHKSGFAVRPER